MALKKKLLIFKRKQKEDLDPQDTKHKGLLGVYELVLRRAKVLVHVLTLVPLYLMACFILASSLFPAAVIFMTTYELSLAQPLAVRAFALSFAFVFGYFNYGFTYLFLGPLANFILRANLKPARGPYFSVDFLNWYIHNGIIYLMRYTFLEFFTPTPYNNLFYKLMGMKIGRGTQINSTNLSDVSLITLGDKVTIGGSATLCAHYGQGGYLVLAPVVIGNNVTIGLKASVMGGVTIGDGAKVMPHSVVLPKTYIPAGETWGGVPAQKISVTQEILKIKKAQ
ncbi:MAG: hypothetical protein IPM57_04165 [Oligoflexia bacterium]|nr:hypothetical protein [Oligoflexia bacterium]